MPTSSRASHVSFSVRDAEASALVGCARDERNRLLSPENGIGLAIEVVE
jgi:hypothetical protein